MMLGLYTQLFPASLRISSFTAARQDYDLQNILSSLTWEFHLNEFVSLTQMLLCCRAILTLCCRKQSFFDYRSEAVKQSTTCKIPRHVAQSFPPSMWKPTRPLWLTLSLTEYRAMGKKEETKPYAPYENKTEHFMSPTALSRGRMKEKGINCVWQILMKCRDSF